MYGVSCIGLMTANRCTPGDKLLFCRRGGSNSLPERTSLVSIQMFVMDL